MNVYLWDTNGRQKSSLLVWVSDQAVHGKINLFFQKAADSRSGQKLRAAFWLEYLTNLLARYDPTEMELGGTLLPL